MCCNYWGGVQGGGMGFYLNEKEGVKLGQKMRQDKT